MSKISIVISYYNSSKTCAELLSRLHQTLQSCSDFQFEIIVVDDGSDDFDLKPIEQFFGASSYPVKVFRFDRNYGQIPAVLAGLAHTESDASVILSSDLQDPPELIGNMLEKWKEGFEVIAGFRVQRNDSRIRNIGSRIWYWFVRHNIHPDFPESGSDYCLVTQRIADSLIQKTSSVRYLQADILRETNQICYIDYVRNKNKSERKSSWSFSKLMVYLMNISFVYADFKKLFLTVHLVFLAFLIPLFFAAEYFGWNTWFLLPLAYFLLVVTFNIQVLLAKSKARKSGKIPVYTIDEMIIFKPEDSFSGDL